jgi:hypothetical protein
VGRHRPNPTSHGRIRVTSYGRSTVRDAASIMGILARANRPADRSGIPAKECPLPAGVLVIVGPRNRAWARALPWCPGSPPPWGDARRAGRARGAATPSSGSPRPHPPAGMPRGTDSGRRGRRRPPGMTVRGRHSDLDAAVMKVAIEAVRRSGPPPILCSDGTRDPNPNVAGTAPPPARDRIRGISPRRCHAPIPTPRGSTSPGGRGCVRPSRAGQDVRGCLRTLSQEGAAR